MPKRKTHEEFVNQVYRLVDNEYTVLGKYLNNHTKVPMRHNVCNYELGIVPTSFLGGTRCPNCNNINKRERNLWSHEKFVHIVYNLVGDEYEVVSKYKQSNIKVDIKHNKCGYIHSVTPADFIHHNVRCPKCSGLLPYTTKTFKEKIFELVKDEYSLMSKYINSRKKVDIKHNFCNFTYKVTPSAFIQGSRCPICCESKGEQKIRYFLKDSNINFEPQYIFDDLYDIKNLRFDFGVLDKNNNLVFLIEFNGIQHYEIVDGWTTKNDFNILQKHDQMKINYCSKNNYDLLVVPYWEFDNIENILTDWLSKYNLI